MKACGSARLALAAILALGLFWPPAALPAAAGFPRSPPAAEAAQPVAALLAQDGARISYHAETGRVRFIGAAPARPIRQPRALPSAAVGADAARGFLAGYGALFGLRNPSQELLLTSQRPAGRGRTTSHFQQVHRGIPVVGGELVVQTDAGHDVLFASGEVLPDISVSITPVVPAAEAAQTALQGAAKWHGLDPGRLEVTTPELWIYDPRLLRPGLGETRLVWRMEVTADLTPVRELVLVDAQEGGVRLHFNLIDAALPPARPVSGGLWYAAPDGDDDLDCASPATPCATINAAIAKAAAGDTILAASGVYTDGGDEVALVDKDLMLSGGWEAAFTAQTGMSVIDGQQARRGVTIDAEVTAVMERWVVQHGAGAAAGSGIQNNGALTLNNSSVISNTTTYVGGGIYTAPFAGRLTVNGSTIAHNTAGGPGGGVFIGNSAVATVTGSLVSGNSAAASGGGGFYVHENGALTISGTTIAGNQTGAPNGAGIHNSLGTLILTDSVVTGNQGVGINSQGWMTLGGTAVSSNTSIGIRIGGGPTEVTDSVIDGNGGGGIQSGGDVVLTNSTISRNTRNGDGGGINNLGPLTLRNVTVSGNRASGSGGGIYNRGLSAFLLISNSTIADNEAPAAGGLSHDYLAGGSATLQNSILARNTNSALNGPSPDCAGYIVSAGHNLVGNKTGCTYAAAAGDLTGTGASPINPQLSALRDFGGPGLMHGLLAGSPALDAGNPAPPGSGGSACLADDQRGAQRPAGAACDMGAFEGAAEGPPFPQLLTYTAGGTSALPGAFLCSHLQVNCLYPADPDAAAAHRSARDWYEFFVTHHGRDSLDGLGMTIVSTVNYCAPSASIPCPYPNAFWNGAQVVYGSAFGFAYADDVAAHELTHGVIRREADLFPYYQSGSIGESLADLWGEFVDQSNGRGTDTPEVKWLLGEDVTGLGAVRNMKDPTAFGDPDRMTSPNYYTGPANNGGIHWNTGVNNKAVYLLTEGGAFNGRTVTALGMAKTAKIYYEALSNLLVSGSDYADLYDALYQACLNLTGTEGIDHADCQAVRDATDAVEMNLQPVAGFNTDAPLCLGGQWPQYLFQDDLESGAANWSLDARWAIDGARYSSYAHSGRHALYGDDSALRTLSAAAMNTGVALPPGETAYLWFAHAHGFEWPNYDGGRLEYSANGGQTWQPVPGAWFTHNGYDGTIATGFENPLAGAEAFLGESHGYISSRASLAALAGQAARFRWVLGTDNIFYYAGWWVDDVRVYVCGPAPHRLFLPLAAR